LILVPVLNDLSRKIEIPQGLRNAILKEYGIRPGSLTRSVGFHVIFVEEGLLFGFISKTKEGGAQVVLHELTMDDEVKLLVGKDFYEFWDGLPGKPTTAEMHGKYEEYIDKFTNPDGGGEAHDGPDSFANR